MKREKLEERGEEERGGSGRGWRIEGRRREEEGEGGRERGGGGRMEEEGGGRREEKREGREGRSTGAGRRLIEEVEDEGKQDKGRQSQAHSRPHPPLSYMETVCIHNSQRSCKPDALHVPLR